MHNVKISEESDGFNRCSEKLFKVNWVGAGGEGGGWEWRRRKQGRKRELRYYNGLMQQNERASKGRY